MATKHYNTYPITTFFRDYLLAGNVSRVTTSNYMSDFNHFMGWVSLNLNLKVSGNRLDNEYVAAHIICMVTGYKAYLVTKTSNVSTFTRKMYSLRKFCQACRETELISEGMYQELVVLTRKSLYQELSWADIEIEFTDKSLLKELQAAH